MSLTPEQLKEMATQLSCPNGDGGVFVADMMHESNFGMTKNTIHSLNIDANDQLLELGNGNGKHIPEILSKAKNATYTGLEISELMKKEAEQSNTGPNVSFFIYDGEKIPFSNASFEKAMTVNTIYFWKNPVELLKEVYRILKAGGIFSIAFAQKEFMEMLPFTQHGFNLYDDSKFELLVKETDFKIIALTHHTEQLKSKANEMVERLYTVAVLQK